ncbi:MAG: rhodanese-like domain-containing protein [Rhodocyclaceae bacterium]|nr:rhodanese-like domain-containing protein [Rhodocyclaceae bacterium]
MRSSFILKIITAVSLLLPLSAIAEVTAVNLAHVQKLIETKADFVLVDSRPERPFNAGTIPGAINISDSKFDKLTDKLPTDKNKPLVFFCGGLKCDLSHKSADKAIALGYKNVVVFHEGYPAWLAATGGAPAATAAGAATSSSSATIEQGKDKGSISIASFEPILKENPTLIQIVDVRDEKDVKKGTFPGALPIPIGEIEKRLGDLPKGKPIVFTCSTGARSGEAYDTVKLLGEGITAYFLDADVSFENGKHTIKGH